MRSISELNPILHSALRGVLIATAVAGIGITGCADGHDAPLKPEAPPTKQTSPQHKSGSRTTRETVDANIEWPADTTMQNDVLVRLANKNQQAVGTSTVPVLLLSREKVTEATTVMTGPVWYAASATVDGLNFVVSGKRRSYTYPHIPAAKGTASVRGHSAHVTQNESIWSATWQENGATYTLEVACEALPDDRCESDTLLLDLAKELSYVGGSERIGGK